MHTHITCFSLSLSLFLSLSLSMCSCDAEETHHTVCQRFLSKTGS